MIMSVARVVGESTAGRMAPLASVANPVAVPVTCLNNGENVLAPRSVWEGSTCPRVGSGVASVLNV